MSDTPIRMGATKQQIMAMVTKPKFDITKHEWSDKAIEFQGTGNNHLSLAAANDEEHCWAHFCILKDDAIAIARHFQLKESDLA